MTAERIVVEALEHPVVPRSGQVPEHWEVRRLRAVLRRVIERNRPDLPLLSVVREKGVIVRNVSDLSSNHNFIPDDLSPYKVVRRGEFAINKMKAWQGSYGVSPCDGIVSPAYHVYAIERVASDYFHIAIRSRAYVPYFNAASDGVRVGQWDLSAPRMREIPFLVPPRRQQAAIVRFLNHADRRIRRYIRAKEKLIELLEEQKQAIIHQAVTGQIDVRTGQPYPAYKESGVEWLGEVPRHWEVRTFTRNCVEISDYRGATPKKTDSGVFLVTAKNIRQGWIDYATSREFVAQEEYSSIMRRGLPRVGDLLITTEAPLGFAALVDREDIALAQRVIRFRLDQSVFLPEFGLHSVLDTYFQNQLLCRGTGSTALGIKASKLPQLRIICPPIHEQRAILEHIQVPLRDCERTMAVGTQLIDLLKECRTRLIADAVTGKLDVREAAAALPDIDPLTAEGTLKESAEPIAEPEPAILQSHP